jgi:hypothetical protein
VGSRERKKQRKERFAAETQRRVEWTKGIEA